MSERLRRQEINRLLEESLARLKHGGQKLTEAAIDPQVYNRVSVFVRQAFFEERYHQPLMLELLLKRSEGVNCSEVNDTIKRWQEGLNVLLRYPMDLYLAPNRPELKIIKLTSGFYEYNINRKLKDAKDFLLAMGYVMRSNTRSDLVLRDTSKLLVIITDLVVLHEDLQVSLEIFETVGRMMNFKSVSGRFITLYHVLLSRRHSQPDVNACIHYLMSDLSLKLPVNEQQSYSSYVDSDGQPSSMIRARRNVSGYLSRGGTSSPISVSSSDPRFSIGSPPPDPSELPPPALTSSQVLRMCNSDNQDADRQPYQEIRFTDNAYEPFADANYKVRFSIGGNEQMIPENYVPAHENTVRRLPQRGSSLDWDRTVPISKKPLRHNSSEGNILDNTGSSTEEYSTYSSYRPSPRYSSSSNPPTAPPPNVVVPQHHYEGNSKPNNYSEQFQYPKGGGLHGNSYLVSTGKNSSSSYSNQQSNSRSHYTKDLSNYRTPTYIPTNDSSSLYNTPNTTTTATTWAGENERQLIRQFSREGMKPGESSRTGSGTIAGSLAGWECRFCRTINPNELPGCKKCQELAPWVDTSPSMPQKTAIETDSSLRSRSPVQHRPLIQHRPQVAGQQPWRCRYCMSLNYHGGIECRQCNQSST